MRGKRKGRGRDWEEENSAQLRELEGRRKLRVAVRELPRGP